MKTSKGLKQAYEIQDFAHASLMALKESLSQTGRLCLTREDAAALAHLVKSWDAAQERIRIHRGKPLPGTMKPSAKPFGNVQKLRYVTPIAPIEG